METGVKTMIWKTKFGKNKTIPEQYSDVILEALSHYPELADTKITFKLTTKHPVPHGTSPAVSGLIAPGLKRNYIITILEDASFPTFEALFKNLPERAQIGAIAHELGHVLQFESLATSKIITQFIRTSSFKERDMERTADRLAIEHGLGAELHVYAVYIRKIVGYTEIRPEIEINYMKPNEILQGLSAYNSGGIGV